MRTVDVKTNFPLDGGKPTLSQEPELTQSSNAALGMGSRVGTNPYGTRRKRSNEQPQTYKVQKGWNK